ncbi:hypothetical protein [Gaetbulibacter aestuarii]|uniref:Uncharacterized protein n=1 Tax=Gaetbulibacter aestuarii TaxID=1502358 RepID=A0ABW7N1H0_9FLAO
MKNNIAYQTRQAVLEFTQCEITFCKKNQSFLLNNQWTRKYTESYFSEKVDTLKNQIVKQLTVGRNQKVYLKELLKLLENRIGWLISKQSTQIIFFKKYRVKVIEANDISAISQSDKLSYDNLSNPSKARNDEDQKIYWFLQSYEGTLTNFDPSRDFEIGLLLYVLRLYKRALRALIEYIKPFHSQADFIDFHRSYGSSGFGSVENDRKDRLCHFNLDKKSVAHFWRILVEEKLIVFDELNESKNLLQLKKFVEDNCSYQNTSKERKQIKTFNREYAEVSARQMPEDKQKHLAFIEELIVILEHRKSSLRA